MYVSHADSCANMCRCTNQSWSCDHPKQMLPQFLSALVNLETTTLLPSQKAYMIMCHTCKFLLVQNRMLSS